MAKRSEENSEVFIPDQVENEALEIEKMFQEQPQQQEQEQVEEQEEVPTQVDEQQVDEQDDPGQDVPTDPDELRKFKDRYLVLKGKYDAEVPRLASELRELKSYIAEQATAEAERRLNQQKPQAPTQEEADPFADAVEQYGEDFVKMVQRIADRVAAEKVEPIKQQTVSVEETQIAAARNAFQAELNSRVGNWQDLWGGKDPGFVEFLRQPDPNGFYTYGEIVEQANNNWDAEKLAKVMSIYNDSKQPKQQPTQTPKTSPSSKSEAAMLAPSRTTPSNAAPTDSSKRVWTAADIAKFERDDRAGKYSDQESMAMYTDLLAAANEGRIRG